MAGHSHSANIQHRKAAQDSKRGKIFTKIIREITVAARQGADINANPRLRLAVDKGLNVNMSRDTIDRAIKRGAGGEEGVSMESIRYEGYGPQGVAVIVDCLTDNRNRAVSDVRYAFTKHGGSLGTENSVSYLFKMRGVICFPAGSDENKIMEVALNAGADDVVTNNDGTIDVLTSFENFSSVKNAMIKEGLNPVNAEATMIASTEVKLDKENGEKVMHLIEALEDLDDVQNVYTNADIPAELFK